MHGTLSTLGPLAWEWPAWLVTSWMAIKVIIGFSIIIFVHELGHFLAAKWCGVRVDRFAIGFGTRLVGWRRGEGLTFGNRPDYRPEELRSRGLGETDYCLKVLPLGGYVRMLGEDDIQIDEKTGEVKLSDDPRAFTSRPVEQRMLVVSAGVVFNLLFAALLFMIVFLVGRDMLAPVVGEVDPDGPASKAGLRSGDRIVSIDGRQADSWMDVQMAEALADGPLRLRIQRAGALLPDETVVTPEFRSADVRLKTMGLQAFQTTRLQADGFALADRPIPQADDRIVEIDGQPVSSFLDVQRCFEHSAGRTLKLLVERTDPANPHAAPARVEVFQRAQIVVSPSLGSGDRPESLADSQHILGMCRRRAVALVARNSPAAAADFKVGDTVLQWGTIANPLYREIVESIRANVGKAISVVVERDGQRTDLRVTPSRPFRLFSSPPPRVGLDFGTRSEEARPIVADVVPGTPAAELNMPRGAELLEVAGQAVPDWFAVIEALRATAGQTIEVRYRAGQETATGRMTVPRSIVDELGLPPEAEIVSIDGVAHARLPSGREFGLASPAAVEIALRERIGQSVTVRYRNSYGSDGTVQTGQFAVRAENADPWQMRIRYVYNRPFAPLLEKVTAHGNPLRAMWMGGKVTWFTVTSIYQTLKQMAKQNVGVENVSGPVGIIDHAIERARAGLVELLFFLAFISVNLAVINFLPLPVVDGGQMVFLLIEKIKGKPLSFKVQMVSTMVGLALIALTFIIVTIQDVTRLLG